MKAISLWQPWASAVSLGLKRFETRHWATLYRGTLAIHAAKTTVGRDFFEKSLMMTGEIRQVFDRENLYSFRMLPKGAIVAVCELEKCLPTNLPMSFTAIETMLGDFSPGRFAWRLVNVRGLKRPYFVVGHQGIFNVPDDLGETTEVL